MQKTIFLILTLLAALRASAVPINIPNEDGRFIFDFVITVGPGSDLPAGTVINGQFGGDVSADYEWVEVNYDIKFDFYDPYQAKHKQHQVAVDGYTDWAPLTRNYGGYFEFIASHPRHWSYFHELEFDFDQNGNAIGYIRGGYQYEPYGDPDIDVERYNYDFTGTISIDVHRDVTNVPEAGSTFGLTAAAFALLVAARKKLTLHPS